MLVVHPGIGTVSYIKSGDICFRCTVVFEPGAKTEELIGLFIVHWLAEKDPSFAQHFGLQIDWSFYCSEMLKYDSTPQAIL